MSKQVELIRDNANEVKEIRADGKKLLKSYANAWKKAEKTPYFTPVFVSRLCRNPFTGAKVECSPVEVTIYGWCLAWYRRYEMGGQEMAGAPIQTYDNMRYLFLELNPDAYYVLLD